MATDTTGMACRKWTRSEDRALALKVVAGIRYRDIGNHLDRPYFGVKARVRVLADAGVIRKERFIRDGARIRGGIIASFVGYEMVDIRLIDELHRRVEERWAETHGEYATEEDAMIIALYGAGEPVGQIAMKVTATFNRSRNARSVTGRLIRLREEGRVGQRIDSPPFAGGDRPTWAPDEDVTLWFLVGKQVPYDLIAFCLDRPFDQVWGKIRRGRKQRSA